MKKVHVTLGIPYKYSEWHWLLSPLRRKKGGLPTRGKIKQIKAEALPCLIVVVEPVANKGGKKDLPHLLKRCRLRAAWGEVPDGATAESVTVTTGVKTE
ncbi:hypothetical protein ACFXTN_031621 [Malus domestica]